VKIFNIDVNFLKTAASKDGMNELSHEIERKLAGLEDMKGLPYDKPDIIRLINSIEKDKIRFVQGDISAKRLYCDVDYSLCLFKIKHSEFDYLKDPAMNAYFS
jgi:hypothetical protein